MTTPTFRDAELISAYLDGQLSKAESSRLETRLASDPELQSIMDDIRQARFVLRKLPQRRAPRNFTLKPQQVGVKPPVPRAFPVFRFASALAGLLLAFSLATNALSPLTMAQANVPMAYGMGGGSGGGGGAEDAQMESSSAAMEAPAAPAAEAPAEPMLAAPTQTSEEAAGDTQRTLEEPTASAKLVPEDSMPAPEPVQPEIPPPVVAQPPIASDLLWLFGGLMLVSGGAAFGLRWWNDRRWREKSQKTK